jgi:hypothetical protein
MRYQIFLFGLAVAVASPAAAVDAFEEGFEGETAGPTILNYEGFANWTVSEGSVDLKRSGDFGVSCRTGNYCVDLDGSTNDAGVLTLATSFAFRAGEVIDIVSWISGNQRGSAADSFSVRLTFAEPTAVLGFQFLIPSGYLPPSDNPGVSVANISGFAQSGDPFRTYGFRFTAGEAGAATLRYAAVGGDNEGPILDDVSILITPIPEAATWAMLIAGFGLVGVAARRRRVAQA